MKTTEQVKMQVSDFNYSKHILIIQKKVFNKTNTHNLVFVKFALYICCITPLCLHS